MIVIHKCFGRHSADIASYVYFLKSESPPCEILGRVTAEENQFSPEGACGCGKMQLGPPEEVGAEEKVICIREGTTRGYGSTFCASCGGGDPSEAFGERSKTNLEEIILCPNPGPEGPERCRRSQNTGDNAFKGNLIY